jgi:hypothetical protein
LKHTAGGSARTSLATLLPAALIVAVVGVDDQQLRELSAYGRPHEHLYDEHMGIEHNVFLITRINPNSQTYAPIGTCFALGGEFFATSFHVTGVDDKNLAIVLPDQAFMDYQRSLTNGPVRLSPMVLHEADPVCDLVILRSPDINVSTTYVLAGSDDVKIGETVCTFGYPHAGEGRAVLTLQAAMVGAKVALHETLPDPRGLVVNLMARPGQSGAPILTANQKQVVGVLAGSYARGGGGQISLGGIDPASLHQTTHAVSAEYLREML